MGKALGMERAPWDMGLEPEWTARDRGEAARGRQQGKGARNGNRAFGEGEMLRAGAGRLQWEQGSRNGDRAPRVEMGDSLGGRGKSCSRGRFRNVRSFGAS